MTKVTTSNSTNPITLSKIDRARVIYAEVISHPAPEGKTHRGIFQDRCEAEISMTRKGANTYFQLLKNQGTPAAPTASNVAAAEGQALDTAAELNALKTQVTMLNRSVNKLLKATANAA